MLQMVFLEGGVIGAKDLRVGLGQLASLELEVGELQSADAVRNLGEPILPGVRCPVEDGLLREDEVQCAVEGVRHHLLAVVVVNFHTVEGLEILEVVRQKHDEVALEPRGESLGVRHFASLVREGLAPKRCLAAESLEAGQDLLPGIHLQFFVRTLAIHQGRCMKRQIRQALSRKVVFHGRYEAVQFVVLLVEDQRCDAVG